MGEFRGLRKHIRRHFSVGAAAVALAMVPAGAASAQTAAAEQARVNLNIPGGELGKALSQLGRQAGVQIAFLPDRVRGQRVKALKGNFTVEQALEQLLSGTALRFQKTSGGSYVVGGPSFQTMEKARDIAQDLSAAQGIGAGGKIDIPEILVRGRRWTLNLDIPRTQDDAQPYVVFTREDIVRSGSGSLEDFFRNYLGANNSGALSTQAGLSKGQSLINLRGLGPDSTLILVDGRRYAQANTGNGVFTQASINGIPMDAIERVEVLASSASGIYGSNAVGGVINIIMRRDYRGFEASAYYGNTSRLDADDRRLSFNGSLPLEKGKTTLSFALNWQKTGALYEGERDFVSHGRARLLANAPGHLNTITQPVQGATPNIVSADGSNLILKPLYGGTSLGSRITYIPAGFRGIGLDGVAPLIANAGKQNLEVSQTPTGGGAGNGGLAPLITPTQTYNASATVKREFASWLSLYAQGGYSRYEQARLTNPAAGSYTLPASAANNPFTRPIIVSAPITEGNLESISSTTTWRALAGGIIKLPYGWQAAIDLNWNWTSYKFDDSPPGFDMATDAAVRNGTINLVRDISLNPPTFTYLNRPSQGLLTPSDSFSRSYTLKVAGPTPFLRLWGGRPIVTLLLEQDKQVQYDYVTYNNTVQASSVNFTPRRSQRTDSVYGEIRLPIVGPDNHVPLFHQLELQVAGRYDRYIGVGANSSLNCFPGVSPGQIVGPLPDSAYSTACPQAGAQPAFARTDNSSTNPTVALSWAPVKDITFRGSYSTGYQPPYLNSLITVDAGAPGTLLAGVTAVNVRDPLRGNEAIGSNFLGLLQVIPAKIGGNPNVEPQTSESWSFGGILTPRWLPGFRFSVDWTRITQKNLYYQPAILLSGGAIPGGQQAFNDFLAAYPERFPRSTNPATFGTFGVGPILSADVTTANLLRSESESIDFAGSYDTKLGNGFLSLKAGATWLKSLIIQTTPLAEPVNSAGALDNLFMNFVGGAGGVSWKGNGSAVYSTDRWSLGLRGRYVGPYYLNAQHTVQPLQGSAKIPSQAYFDVFGTYKIFTKTELRAGVNNVFDKSPPINATVSLFYSQFGDPRRANFYLSVNQRF
ncbi:TonB-dependent receptor [Sphingobium chlorophenolicum]|uniref:Outer membrane receptor for ferrienterochelin and colicin n=1 Tax=Sphingobium chlorophenolicum TaxID=46429 RepID=A0A081RDX4_SPHCR|nr:TonB-dependent receptor [Sphingobium chlorophenolicum]KEQ53397.1 Outer membrane receptor for ferrienterochelin and colicin precursor [Sphingobium chlorophenolicum]